MAKAKKDKSDEKKNGPEEGAVAAALSQAARAVRMRLSRHLSDHGLYAGQDGVIMTLAEEDGQSPGTIADRLGVRAPTITKTINRLAAQGFVEKRGSDADGRKASVHLTKQGQATVTAIGKALRRTEKAMLDGLSGKEAKVLAKLLRRVDRNLQASET